MKVASAPMKVAIDIGCARYGGDYSIERLEREAFDGVAPDIIYGCDPNPVMDSMIVHYRDRGGLVVTRLELRKAAAWTYDGEVGYFPDGLNSQIGDHPSWPKVECFDIATLIEQQGSAEIVLKLDCEGAEYELLEHLIARRADERLKRLLVEWHARPDIDHKSRRFNIERRIFCPVEEWTH